MSDNQELLGKIVLITGASRGIGKAAALEAAKRGAHIIATARTKGALEELDDEINELGATATLVPFDLANFDAIDRLGAQIFERWGKLDALIGNAGILGTLTPVPHISPKDFDKVMAINVGANYRLLRSMDLLLRKSEAGRVLFVSSSSAKSCKPYWGLYASSKAALNALAKSYANEMSNTNVKVNIFYPGAVRTAMRAKAMPGEDPKTLPHPSKIAPALIDMISPSYIENSKIFDVRENSLIEL